MIVEGRFTFRGPRDTVYDLLQDPSVLARALPGAQRLEQTGDGRFEGVMSVGVGPVTAGQFTVSVELRDRVRPERFGLDVEGKGAVGHVRGTATVTLEPGTNVEETVMAYRADLQIGGRIAGVGQRLLDSASRQMTRQGLEALSRELAGRLEPAPAAGSPVAARRARPGRRPILWAAAVAVALLAIVGFCAAAP